MEGRDKKTAINHLIEQGKATSRQAYIIQAVKNQLEVDGLPVDFDTN